MATVSQSKKAPIVDQFAKELSKALADGRTTVAGLVEATGLSRMQIYRLRTGKNKPSLETAEAVAKHIGLKIVFEKAGKP
jgi:DNA-binding phage protein